MSKSKKSSHLESVDSNPTTGLQLEGDIKSAITKDNEHIYMVGNEEHVLSKMDFSYIIEIIKNNKPCQKID